MGWEYYTLEPKISTSVLTSFLNLSALPKIVCLLKKYATFKFIYRYSILNIIVQMQRLVNYRSVDVNVNSWLHLFYIVFLINFQNMPFFSRSCCKKMLDCVENFNLQLIQAWIINHKKTNTCIRLLPSSTYTLQHNLTPVKTLILPLCNEKWKCYNNVSKENLEVV